MNTINLIGRITKDPDVRYTQNGTAYTSFTLAVNRTQKNSNGEYIADFIPCKAFSNTAEYLGRYIHKGNQIAVVGTLQSGSFQKQDGSTQYTLDVLVNNIFNLTPRDPNAEDPNKRITKEEFNNSQPPVQNRDTFAVGNEAFMKERATGQPYTLPKNEVADDDLPF